MITKSCGQAVRCPHVQCVILTHTCVGSHRPGEGANLPGVLRLPQALQLGEFTGCADERAQALKREWRVRSGTG